VYQTKQQCSVEQEISHVTRETLTSLKLFNSSGYYFTWYFAPKLHFAFRYIILLLDCSNIYSLLSILYTYPHSCAESIQQTRPLFEVTLHSMYQPCHFFSGSRAKLALTSGKILR